MNKKLDISEERTLHSRPALEIMIKIEKLSATVNRVRSILKPADNRGKITKHTG